MKRVIKKILFLTACLIFMAGMTTVSAQSEEQIEKFSEPYLREHFQPQRSPCWGCPANHSTIMTITEGPYAGTIVEEPEYEQMAAWGPVIDNKDAAAAAFKDAEYYE